MSANGRKLSHAVRNQAVLENKEISPKTRVVDQNHNSIMNKRLGALC